MIQDVHFVDQIAQCFEIVLDNKKSNTFSVQQPNTIDDLFNENGVDAGKRLVEQNDFWG